ncbi:hypothetical protein [Yersinia pseudotuberculosis]|uniref:hypothetical protein n=1 Tax=Yersinia pseudotuberculosis TaxID=633 RepID=UPI000F83F1B1|nr:hypothetical protein [Yersinia pseudotuberculosis]
MPSGHIVSIELKYACWVAAQLNTQRSTVKKYANDSKGERHAIVNGRLMVGTTGRKRSV